MLEEYNKAVYQILEVLVEYKFSLHSKKCELDKKYIKYLDLVILEDQVKIDPMYCSNY